MNFDHTRMQATQAQRGLQSVGILPPAGERDCQVQEGSWWGGCRFIGLTSLCLWASIWQIMVSIF